MSKKSINKLNRRIQKLEEKHRAQLKVISLASLQYNQTLRIPYGDPNWTTTYEDVCNSIDREILLRERCETLEKTLMDSKNIKREDLDVAVDLLSV